MGLLKMSARLQLHTNQIMGEIQEKDNSSLLLLKKKKNNWRKELINSQVKKKESY